MEGGENGDLPDPLLDKHRGEVRRRQSLLNQSDAPTTNRKVGKGSGPVSDNSLCATTSPTPMSTSQKKGSVERGELENRETGKTGLKNDVWRAVHREKRTDEGLSGLGTLLTPLRDLFTDNGGEESNTVDSTLWAERRIIDTLRSLRICKDSELYD